MKQLASIACRHATTDGRWGGAGTRAGLAAMAFTPIIAPFLLLDLRIARFRLAEFQLRRPQYEFFTPTALAGESPAIRRRIGRLVINADRRGTGCWPNGSRNRRLSVATAACRSPGWRRKNRLA